MIRICQKCGRRYEDDKIGDYGWPYLCSSCDKEAKNRPESLTEGQG